MRDGLPPGEPVIGTVSLDPPLSAGNSSFIVDSFFDVTYEIDFTETGTGNPAPGGQLTGKPTLLMEDAGMIPIFQQPGSLRVIPGFDGSSFNELTFSSPGGGHTLTLLSAVPEPSAFALSAIGLITLGFAGWLRRR